MARSTPEKLAQALRANLRRRKGPEGLKGAEDGRAPKRAPSGIPAPEGGPEAQKAPESPVEKSRAGEG